MRLNLKAKNNNWERFLQRRNHELFKKVRADILHRDAFTCQYCFHVGQNLEIINVDNDYANNTPSNLVSACELCAKCTLLDAYPLEYSGQDKIIYLPELLQEQVNQLCRSLFCKMNGEGEGAYNAKVIFAQLQDRANWLNEKAGFQLSQPGLYAMYYNQHQKETTLLGQLRWLPAVESYQASIPQWKIELEAMLD